MARSAVAVAVTATAILALAGLAQVTAGAPKGIGANDTAIRKAVTDGLTASQTAPLAPDGKRGKKLDAGTIADMKRNARATLGKYYAGVGLDDRVKALDAAIAEEAPGSVVFLASGVDNVVLGNIVVTGNSATATGSAEVWLDVAQVQEDGSLAVAHPRNTLVLTFGLEWRNGAWMIVSQNGAFAPGSEP